MKRRIIFDIVLIVASVLLTVVATKIGLLDKIMSHIGQYKILAIFVAGWFNTSVFTIAPAIALIGSFAKTTSLIELTLIGSLGAVICDYMLFRFVKDRISTDLYYILSSTKEGRFAKIFHTKIFRFLTPMIGAIIIASPLPDEIGITMLGLTKMDNKKFLLIAYVMNAVGIVVIGVVARLVV